MLFSLLFKCIKVVRHNLFCKGAKTYVLLSSLCAWWFLRNVTKWGIVPPQMRGRHAFLLAHSCVPLFFCRALKGQGKHRNEQADLLFLGFRKLEQRTVIILWSWGRGQLSNWEYLRKFELLYAVYTWYTEALC